MKHLFVFFTAFLLVFCGTPPASSQPFLTGIWTGKLAIPGGGKLTLAITFSFGKEDSLRASLRSIEQSPDDFPFDKVILDGRKILLGMRSLSLEVEGTIDQSDTTMVCDFRQGGFTFPLVLHKTNVMPRLNRPQEPTKPYPYNEEEIIFENKQDKITLAGTLTLPKGKGPFPAVILISGSGPQNRDEELFGHKPFLILADYLTRKGIAVLRFDDRGTGKSTGQFNEATTDDFASDVRAALAYLDTRRDIDHRKTGLIGHSEGGIVAPLVAASSRKVAFVVLLAGPGVGMDQIVLYQIERQLRLLGKPEEQIQAEINFRKNMYNCVASAQDTSVAARRIRELYAGLSETERNLLAWSPEQLEGMIKVLSNPWWRHSLSCQPAETLKRVKCPILALNGSKNTQVPPDLNLNAIQKALEEGKNKMYTVKKLDDLNHLFQKCKTGESTEYGTIEETMNPAALDAIGQWIDEILPKI